MDEITNADRVSPLWGKLMRMTQERIAAAQGLLESNLDLDETNRVRGRLIELRYLAGLDQSDPIVS